MFRSHSRARVPLFPACALFAQTLLRGQEVKDVRYYSQQAANYVANSQWGAVDKTGNIASPDKLREALILKMKL